MNFYTKKQEPVQVITFDEFITYGKQFAANLVNFMPWSFDFMGYPVSHETDERYLIPTSEGTLNFTPNDVLIYENETLSVLNKKTFEQDYETINRKYRKNVRIMVQNSGETAQLFAERIENSCNTIEGTEKGILEMLQFTTASDGRQTANITYLTSNNNQ